MQIYTNIEAIKENVSIPFLYLDIEKTKFDFLVQHPYLETPFVCTENNETKNILEDSNVYLDWLKIMCKRIKNATSFIQLYMMIRKSYRMTFLKFAKPYMSLKDFSYFLADAWTSSENPNNDVNCNINLLISWFKYCDKQILMTKEEYITFTQFQQKITVYRGVSVNGTEKGLSWTVDLNKANWFAHRFDNHSLHGYVIKTIVDKNDILAYFTRRNENEIVIDINKTKDIIVV